MMARRVTTKDKWKSKVWFDILAPKQFGEKEVGETPANEAKDIIGRTIGVPASEVSTGKKLNLIKLVFEVKEVTGNKAKTKLISYEVVRSYIRSIVRRRKNRVDLVKNYELEGRKVRVKALAMTAGKCYSNQEKNIRKTMEQTIDELVHGKTVDNLIESVLDRKIQDEIRARSKKIFPLSNVEIRKIELLS
ncbi:MAG: 30S ribosomal protein S3ae [Candidatus Altiarchaeota archaeon]|nr:30S ribosomal protein S3ae [Candidatus Altiarchaeota archaeon]